MNAYLLDFARTPFQFARKGLFAALPPAELAAQLVRGLLGRQAFDPAELEDVLLGCAYPEGEQGDNLARIVALLAGLPQHVAGATINRFCGSSMTSIHAAAGSIATGAGEAFLCLGVESMSKVPQGGLHPSPSPALQQLRPETYTPMGITAENVAQQYSISRELQEQFAVESQAKTATAQSAGAFADELIPVQLPDGRLVTQDGCLRPATTPEGLAALKPAFAAEGTVTAGTSSPLTDGAAAVLVVSEAFLRRHHLTPLAQLRAVAVAGVGPEVMGLGPIPATTKALARAGLPLADIDVVELNEAFAAQALACQQELGIGPDKLNLDGGALALGHPLPPEPASRARPPACSGARAAATRWPPSASGAGRALPPCLNAAKSFP